MAQASLAFCSALIQRGARLLGDAAVFVPGVADHLAVAHDNHALAIGGNVQLMRHHEDGDAVIVQFLENIHDLDAGPRVEIAGRFIGQQEFGRVHQGAGDRDALLLAAGKLA